MIIYLFITIFLILLIYFCIIKNKKENFQNNGLIYMTTDTGEYTTNETNVQKGSSIEFDWISNDSNRESNLKFGYINNGKKVSLLKDETIPTKTKIHICLEIPNQAIKQDKSVTFVFYTENDDPINTTVTITDFKILPPSPLGTFTFEENEFVKVQFSNTRENNCNEESKTYFLSNKSPNGFLTINNKKSSKYINVSFIYKIRRLVDDTKTFVKLDDDKDITIDTNNILKYNDFILDIISVSEYNFLQIICDNNNETLLINSNGKKNILPMSRNIVKNIIINNISDVGNNNNGTEIKKIIVYTNINNPKDIIETKYNNILNDKPVFKLESEYQSSENTDLKPIDLCVHDCIYNNDINQTCGSKNDNTKKNISLTDKNMDYYDPLEFEETGCKEIIKYCQNVCLECDDKTSNRKLTQIEKENLDKCKFLYDFSNLINPEAPIIRGFGGNGRILLEWKEGNNGNSEILQYIISYYETYNKNNGIQIKSIIYDQKRRAPKIVETELLNLKNQTFYTIHVVAKNGVGHSNKSNSINVETSGLNSFNSMLNMFTEINEEDENENIITNFNCNERKNVIDNLTENDIDLSKYIYNLVPEQEQE